MRHIVRYARNGEIRAGVQAGDTVHPLPLPLPELLRLPLDDLRDLVTTAADSTPPEPAPGTPLAPVDGRMEVWAAGVTYRRSRQARVTESEADADVYERVYDAERPELFFKSTAWRVVGPGGTIAVRQDSVIDVPEPELALVVNAHGEIAGYTVCDDVSSRTIEGANPLYLPQAKVYLGACALGPAIRPAWEVPDPYALPISMRIHRDGALAWSGEASTAELHRRLDDLVAHLFAADVHPDGVVLATGTCLVPDLPFTLATGDTVHIEIGEVGALTTGVVRGRPPLP
ncbi:MULTISPECIES: fumarylacetoacetate hydrolase family protein [Nonomuraea]|uniref:fumarylacetoacetate hydrolase family protein n=1 Tax=Nonomuraea TaxID=83681 RepID=UPI001C5FA567|nr:fumarylacetoacetate hydrolase family protein [Nonomuraea ceibae]